MFKWIKLYTLKKFSPLYINYTSIKLLHTHTHTHTCFCMLALGPLHAFSIVFTLLEAEEAPGDGTRWQGQCPG